MSGHAGAGTGRLAGRRVLVTGAASGIGAAVARRFAGEAARVALLDRDAEKLASVAAEIDALALPADVTDAVAVARAVDAAARGLAGLDGVVNGAGVSIIASFEDTDEATWHRALDINLTGPYRVCHAALRHLRDSGGATIVNISSAVGIQPLLRRSAYAASKGGLIAFGKVLALELAPAIRVNTVLPGAIDTPMVHNSFTGPALDQVVARYALKRLGRAEEVAEAVLFLTSGESGFVTGATLTVDGGRTFY